MISISQLRIQINVERDWILYRIWIRRYPAVSGIMALVSGIRRGIWYPVSGGIRYPAVSDIWHLVSGGIRHLVSGIWRSGIRIGGILNLRVELNTTMVRACFALWKS
jgi:hypothetical protein